MNLVNSFVNDSTTALTGEMGHIRALAVNTLWAMKPEYLQAMIQATKSETPTPKAFTGGYNVVADGIAVIELRGVMSKGDFFFGASTRDIRSAVRGATQDTAVKAILMIIDSPGGFVAGTKELADEVAAAAESKPVIAQIEDLGASAAFWVASQATSIFANATAEVGSIGTVAVVEDTSGMYENAGVKVHVVSTGDFKGAFTDGAPVTPEQLSELQTRVEEINEVFLGAIQEGRSISRDALNNIADGRVFLAETAQKLGLIDGVQSIESTVKNIAASFSRDRNRQRAHTIAEKFSQFDGVQSHKNEEESNKATCSHNGDKSDE